MAVCMCFVLCCQLIVVCICQHRPLRGLPESGSPPWPLYWANLAIACVVDHLPYMVSYAVNYGLVVLFAGGQVISFLF